MKHNSKITTRDYVQKFIDTFDPEPEYLGSRSKSFPLCSKPSRSFDGKPRNVRPKLETRLPSLKPSIPFKPKTENVRPKLRTRIVVDPKSVSLPSHPSFLIQKAKEETVEEEFKRLEKELKSKEKAKASERIAKIGEVKPLRIPSFIFNKSIDTGMRSFELPKEEE